MSDWVQLREQTQKLLLDHIPEFPLVVIDLVLLYYCPVLHNNKPIQIFKDVSIGDLYGIISDQHFLYLCDYNASVIRIYNLQGQAIENNSLMKFVNPADIDFYADSLYIIDKTSIHICNLNFKLLSHIPLPTKGFTRNHLKVDSDVIYVTISDSNQILVYEKNGSERKSIGKERNSSELGSFNSPKGVTIDENNLYVCDCNNDRVQVLFKQEHERYPINKSFGMLGTGLGQFRNPYSIHYSEDCLFVGDEFCLQVFTCDGLVIQRIGGSQLGSNQGEFSYVWGICVVKDRLYVSDSENRRIQIFQRK